MNCEELFKMERKSGVVFDRVQIGQFCATLRANKVGQGLKEFLLLPQTVQCVFLSTAWDVLTGNIQNYSEDSYMTCFLLFKLFRGAAKKEPVFQAYAKHPDLEAVFKVAKEQVGYKRGAGKSLASSPRSSPLSSPRTSPLSSPRSSPLSSPRSSSVTVSKKPKKIFDKKYQKYESPISDKDPLYIFYSTLYAEKPESKLAITWLTERGVGDGKEREELERKYTFMVRQKL